MQKFTRNQRYGSSINFIVMGQPSAKWIIISQAHDWSNKFRSKCHEVCIVWPVGNIERWKHRSVQTRPATPPPTPSVGRSVAGNAGRSKRARRYDSPPHTFGRVAVGRLPNNGTVFEMMAPRVVLRSTRATRRPTLDNYGLPVRCPVVGWSITKANVGKW
jgi:hypothetical protein